MKNLAICLITLFCISVSASVNAQNNTVTGNKKYVTKKTEVSSFTSLQLQGSPNVIYTQTKAGNPIVEIYASENIIPFIETIVEKNTLSVRIKNNTIIRKSGKIEVKVSAPTLENIKIQGSGDITLANGIENPKLAFHIQGSGNISGEKIICNNLTVSVQGSGNVELHKVKTNNADIHINGSGNTKLSGTSTNAKFSVNGSGGINAANLISENVEANINGSGDISCHTNKTLKGKVNGSGSVTYKGNPEISFSKKGLRKL